MQLAQETPVREVTIFVCSLCKEPFELSSSLVGHMIAIHTNNNAIDELLRKVSHKFQRKATYVTKNRGNKRYHQCTQCPFKVKYIDTILKHIERHNEEVTIYGCPVCLFRTIHPMNLKLHMLKKHKDRIIAEPKKAKMKTVKVVKPVMTKVKKRQRR